MGFYQSFSTSQYAYREFSNQIRGRRLTFGEIDGVVHQLYRWRSEFQSLSPEARAERQPWVAEGKIAEMVKQIEEKIDRMEALRKRLNQLFSDTQQQIQRYEESLSRLNQSLRYDRDKFLNMRTGPARSDFYRRIQDKERKLKDMEDNLSRLRQKMSDMGQR